MSIELLILSGSRQRESLRFTQPSLTIGGDETCDVAFPPKKDPHAKGQWAKLELDENGWWIHNLGDGPWYINRRILPVEGSAMLRSGDVLRLSDAGPDLRFTLLADPKPVIRALRQSGPGKITPLVPDVFEAEAIGAPSSTADEAEAAPSETAFSGRLVWLLAFLALVLLMAALGFFATKWYFNAAPRSPQPNKPNASLAPAGGSQVQSEMPYRVQDPFQWQVNLAEAPPPASLTFHRRSRQFRSEAGKARTANPQSGDSPPELARG